MKPLIIALSLLFISSSAILPQPTIAQHTSVSFQVFYDELSPYGRWIENPDYGYVWLPDVPTGFAPYSTNGYWVYTDDGWTWVSLYSWGWAPFHYGRWYFDANYGYVWVPGNEWGPGWVVWRHSPDYYGWAPIGPGISISIAYSSGYSVPHSHWRFVHCRDFGSRHIYRHYINHTHYTTIYNNTVVINNVRTHHRNNVRYNAGPEVNDVEKRVGRRVERVPIKESTTPIRNERTKNALQVYRPEITANASTDRRPAPAKITNPKDLKTITGKPIVAPTPAPNATQPGAQKSTQPRMERTQPNQPAVQPSQPPLRRQPRVQQSPPSTSQPQVQPNQPRTQPQVQPSPAPSQPQVQPNQPRTQPRAQPSPAPQKQPKVQPNQPRTQPRVQPSPPRTSTQPRQVPQPPKQQPTPERRERTPKE